jgi:hypothetical protein
MAKAGAFLRRYSSSPYFLRFSSSVLRLIPKISAALPIL